MFGLFARSYWSTCSLQIFHSLFSLPVITHTISSHFFLRVNLYFCFRSQFRYCSLALQSSACANLSCLKIIDNDVFEQAFCPKRYTKNENSRPQNATLQKWIKCGKRESNLKLDYQIYPPRCPPYISLIIYSFPREEKFLILFWNH